MATKSGHQEPEKAEVIEEQLDALVTAIDRVKVLYEQYFLGIQKQAPAFLHTDIERKIRDLTQLQIRNTALRYRFATLQQKFGAYNSYWRRTLRQIENGTYTRNLSKIGRQAARTGEEVPEEILAAMPKRMREQVRRDRQAALAIAARRDRAADEPEPLTFADDEVTDHDGVAFVGEPAEVRRTVRTASGAHRIEEDDGFDIDAFFASITSAGEPGAPDELPHGRPEAAARRAPTVPPPHRSAPTVPPTVPPPRAPTVPPPLPRSAPRAPTVPPPARPVAPSQATRPLPVTPGAAAGRAPTSVETLSGPFPRIPTAPVTAATGAGPTAPDAAPPGPPSRPSQPRVAVPRQPPPPGMTDADVNALYASYIKAKKSLGEDAGPGAYGTLLRTINAQAPKIMEQYRARGVEFSVIVKDQQVVIRAKPKV